MSNRNYKIEQDKKNLEKTNKILGSYENKNITVICEDIIKNKKSIVLKEIFDTILEYKNLMENKIKNKEDKINEQQKENKILIKEASDDEDTMHNQLDKIENYENRIIKLRDKVKSRNNKIYYLYFIIILSIIHTFIFTKYGFYSYYYFWYNISKLLFNLIKFIILFIPNTCYVLYNSKFYFIKFKNMLNLNFFSSFIKFKNMLYLNLNFFSTLINAIYENTIIYLKFKNSFKDNIVFILNENIIMLYKFLLFILILIFTLYYLIAFR